LEDRCAWEVLNKNSLYEVNKQLEVCSWVNKAFLIPTTEIPLANAHRNSPVLGYRF